MFAMCEYEIVVYLEIAFAVVQIPARRASCRKVTGDLKRGLCGKRVLLSAFPGIADSTLMECVGAECLCITQTQIVLTNQVRLVGDGKREAADPLVRGVIDVGGEGEDRHIIRGNLPV